MRPRRTSVALCTDGKLRVLVEVWMEGIIASRSLFVVRYSPKQARGNRGKSAQSLAHPPWVALRMVQVSSTVGREPYDTQGN